MGQGDWADITNALTFAAIRRGTTGDPLYAPPPGAGSFVFGYRSVTSDAQGVHAKYVDLTGFTPTGTGTSPSGSSTIRGCVKRCTSGANTGFSPFLYAAAQGGPPGDSDYAYMLGLSDADPYSIMLAKAPLSIGLHAEEGDATFFVIGQSTAQYSMADGHWHHLRLDAIMEPNGDALLRVYQNNLTLHPLSGVPTWEEIPGIEGALHVDGVLEDNGGLPPLWGGYLGFGMAVRQASNRRAAFKAIEAGRVPIS